MHKVLLRILLLLSPLCLSHGQDVILEPGGITVLEEGSSITLICNTTFPDTVISYTFMTDGVEVQNSTNDSFIIEYTDKGSLSLGGVYICATDNGTDVSESNSSVLIYFAPVITHNPASIYLATNNSSFQLSCSAMGYPSPSIKWLRLAQNMDPANIAINDRNIFNQSLSIASSNRTCSDQTVTSTLSFNPVFYKDYGDYVCVAILDIDEDMEKIDADVLLAISDISTVSGKESFRYFLIMHAIHAFSN